MDEVSDENNEIANSVSEIKESSERRPLNFFKVFNTFIGITGSIVTIVSYYQDKHNWVVLAIIFILSITPAILSFTTHGNDVLKIRKSITISIYIILALFLLDVFVPFNPISIKFRYDKVCEIDENDDLSYIDFSDSETWFLDYRDKSLHQRFKVLKDGKWGMIDEERNLIVKPKYTSLQSSKYSFNRYIVVDSNRYGVIDKYGQTIIPQKYNEIQPLMSGNFLVREEDCWGAYDENGKLTVYPKFLYLNESCYISNDSYEYVFIYRNKDDVPGFIENNRMYDYPNGFDTKCTLNDSMKFSRVFKILKIDSSYAKIFIENNHIIDYFKPL